MIRKTMVLITLALAFPFVSAAAQPNWDIDYQLYVGIDDTKYEIWIDPVDGSPYKHSTHYSEYDASWNLFKLYEWNQVPSGASVWIEEVDYVKWHYWLTFETVTQANEAADDFHALGFPTKITPVFGGYLHSFEISPNSNSSDLRFFMNMAAILDDDDSDRR